MEQFPGNNPHKPAGPAAPDTTPVNGKKSIEPIQGIDRVIRKKKSLGRRFAEAFIGNSDSQGVFGYLLTDVLVPAVKATLTEIIVQGLEKTLYGSDVRPNSTYRPRTVIGGQSRTHVSYNQVTSPKPGPATPRRGVVQPELDIDEIILPRRVQAQAVYDKMIELIDEYGTVSVADLNEMLGQSSSYTDHKWGWTDLTNSGIKPVREGFLLVLPSVEDIR